MAICATYFNVIITIVFMLPKEIFHIVSEWLDLCRKLKVILFFRILMFFDGPVAKKQKY